MTTRSRRYPMPVEIVAVDAGELGVLVEAWPFKPYRNYRVLSRRRQADVTRAEIDGVLKTAGARVCAERDARGLAAVVVFQPLPWDSGFFGVPMGRFTHAIRSPEAPRQALVAAVEAGIAHARALGVRHVAARADVADTDAIGVLEDHGFRLMDALATYIVHPRRELPPPPKEMGVLRHYRPEDAEQVLDITREAFRGFRGRFHLDPHLPDERCDELYLEWARKACSFQMADVVLVTEDGHGELHGWTSYRQIEPVSTVGGVPVCGAGLGACRRSHPGAYVGLIRGGTALVHGRGGVSECQTQNFNFATIRVYEAAAMQYVRADYSFHAWLG